MSKQQPTATGRKLATKVEGHEIQKPRLLDAENEREVTRRNDQAIVDAAADAGFKEIDASPTVDKTADVKEKKG